MEKDIDVYGIGNPLIDVLVDVDDKDLKALGLEKGVMHLVDERRRKELLEHVKAMEVTYLCGGACPNTIIALASLGLKTALAGKTGVGKHAEIYQKTLKNDDVKNDLRTGKGPTGSSIIMVTPDNERTMCTHLGMCQHFSSDDLDPDSIRRSKILYFTGYMWDTDSQKSAVKEAIWIAHGSGTKVIFDIADPFCVDKNRSEFLELIEKDCDVVFANEEEAKMLFRKDDPAHSLSELAKMSDVAIVKIGSKGALIRSSSEELQIPVNSVSAIDTTGAGDMFAAGFIYGISLGMDLYNSGVFASYLASHVVTQKGSQFLQDKRLEIISSILHWNWDYLKGSY